MSFAAPFVGSVQKIEDRWIDYNGHFNMAYYNVLFDRASDEAFALLGLGPGYVKDHKASFFTLEAHVTYLRELNRADPVRVKIQILDYDAKRVHYFEEMVHADDGWIAATSENIVMHVDMAAKKSAPFPPEILMRIQAMHAAHSSLPVPPQVGHRIGIARKNP